MKQESKMDDDYIDLSNAELYADSNRGVYIPQHFAESINRACVTGVSEEDYNILLAGPEHEFYWETWGRVTDNAVITNPNTGKECYLYQDGDLWVVPK
jgi:hypothetical protein